jgi:glutathione synthase/RimK-type ligase-like ATP-grasp enzyme
LSHVIIVTEDRFEQLGDDPFSQMVRAEDELLRHAIERHGNSVDRVSWSRPDFDWGRADIALVRGTWDYAHRPHEFARWIDTVSSATRLVNARTLIRWNIDKRYLFDLERQGVPLPPSRLIPQQEQFDLPPLFAECGWPEAVLKPVVSLGARETYRLNAAQARELAPHAKILAAGETLILQQFLPSILDEGELSAIAIAGQITHGVRKIGRPGDFRVQSVHGGTAERRDLRSDERRFASDVLAACPEPPMYARIDMVRNSAGQLCLMELELIEPELFFRLEPAAADALADALTRRLPG